jgi:hypothetical protein
MTTAIPWERRNGHLSAIDRWRIALQAVGAQLAARRQRRTPVQTLDDQRALSCIEPPAGALAEAVWRHASAAQAPWLLNHALRTYAWARLLAFKDGIAHEVDTVFAAALLHDVGLTEAAAVPADACFAVRGALSARQFLLRAGGTADQAYRVSCAIALHMDMTVSVEERGVDAHLLQAGAAFDVVGRRLREVAKPLRERVLQRHPRMNLKQELCNCMRHAAAAAPGTRLAYYTGRLGFLDLIQRAPFDE